MKTKREPPTERQYQIAKYSIAISFCPSIVPCKKCGWPVVKGYCCTYCFDTNPGSSREEDETYYEN